jgi:hypothetical protein
MTQGEAIQRLFTRLPNVKSIQDMDTEKGYKSFTFTWMGVKYKVDYSFESIHVDEIEGSLLKGSDRALLMNQLLKLEP